MSNTLHPFFAACRVIDLSQPLHTGIPLWAGDPEIELETWASYAQNGYFIQRLSLGEHSGTHWGTPNTFLEDGRTVQQFSAQDLFLPAVLIDIRSQCLHNVDYQLSVDDIDIWEQQHGLISPNSLVIIYTGWQDKWATPLHFFNIDADGIAHFPGFSAKSVHYLLQHRQIKALGTDTHGIDAGINTAYSASLTLYTANSFALECLAGLEQLPALGAYVMVGGLAALGGSGGPARVLAILPPETAQP